MRRGLWVKDRVGQRFLARESYARNKEARRKTAKVYEAENHELILKQQRDRWAANREENHLKRAEYRKKNAESISLYNQRAHERHREKHNANMRDYQARNREAIAAQRKEWYARQKENPALWGARLHKQKEREERNFFRTRQNRLRHRFESKVTARDLWSLWKSQRGLCGLTGEPLDRYAHIDHIIPVSRGGKTEKTNLRFLSPTANMIKRHYTDQELMNFCAAVIATIGGLHSIP